MGVAGLLAFVEHFAHDLDIFSMFIILHNYYLQVKVDVVDAAVNKLKFAIYIFLFIFKGAGIKSFCALKDNICL